MDSSLVDAKGFTEGFMDTVRALVAAKADPS
jgi:hypothetical protein